MLNIANGIKVTLLSLVVISLAFYVAIDTQHIWLSKVALFEQSLYGLFIITIIFSAHFSRSRFTFLTIIFALFYITINEQLAWSNWVLANQSWLLLSGLFIFALLSQLKERGVISAHGISRVILFGLCGLSAYVWGIAIEVVIEQLNVNQFTSNWNHYLLLEVPILLVSLLLLWRSIVTANLVVVALLISCIVWCLHFYKIIELPWSVTLTVLVSYYLLVVVVESYFFAYRDELTGLPSRRALNQLALSLSNKYSIAVVDIDFFKKFNDSYGHDIGDQVLKLVASKLNTVKKGGKVFRYGGEEFCIVFPRKNTEQILTELERIRLVIANYKMVIRSPKRKTKEQRNNKKNKGSVKKVSVSVSIGVAQKERNTNFEQTFKLADQALYKAKKTGRNKVCG
ncbi:diguanylate cyclase [Thalassomonas sp. M1454]|uniref:GGDEF domain-containing protein n=1 Tax=Thalassomonas sp. M1454 TaxID=2594477 RepID=UPI00163DA713|nr:GGDEF domain-containing protein [Thalassomonas sp. M1454]